MFNEKKFMEHLKASFPSVYGFGCQYGCTMAENIVDFAMREKNYSAGQLEHFLTEIFPEITEEEVSRYSKRNTKIRYRYRDAANNHLQEEVILEGILTQEQEEEILETRIDGEWFDPEMCGLPMPSFINEGYEEDDELDHDWCELGDDAFTYTDEDATESLTAEQVYDLFTR